MSEEEIQSKVKELIEKIEQRGNDLIDEEDGESSMLCELSVKNFINFLKHFKVNLDFTQFQQDEDNEDNNDGSNKEMKEENEKMKEIILKWTNKCFDLESKLSNVSIYLFHYLFQFIYFIISFNNNNKNRIMKKFQLLKVKFLN